MPFFSLLRFDQNKTTNNAFLICKEKKTFFDLKKQNFSKSKKSPFFSKGLTHAFGQKNAIFFLYLDLIKMRLEMTLSEFAIKRETFFDLKIHNFSKFKNYHVFSKELTHAFGQKMPIFSLFRFGQNKT